MSVTIIITQEDLDRVEECDDICNSEGIGPSLDDLIERMRNALEEVKHKPKKETTK